MFLHAPSYSTHCAEYFLFYICLNRSIRCGARSLLVEADVVAAAAAASAVAAAAEAEAAAAAARRRRRRRRRRGGGGGEAAAAAKSKVDSIFELSLQRRGNPNPPFVWQIALFKLYPTVYLNPIKVFGSTCVTLLEPHR